MKVAIALLCSLFLLGVVASLGTQYKHVFQIDEDEEDWDDLSGERQKEQISKEELEKQAAEKMRARDLFLDEVEARSPAGHVEMMKKMEFNLSTITYSADLFKMTVPSAIFSSTEGRYLHAFDLVSISTAFHTSVFEAGSLQVKGAILRPFNLISMRIKPQWAVRLHSAKMTVQLETDGAESATRTILLDSLLADNCQLKDGEHVCSGTFTLGPFFMPAFPEVEMRGGNGKRGEAGSLRLLITSDRDEWLLDARIFVAKTSSPRD